MVTVQTVESPRCSTLEEQARGTQAGDSGISKDPWLADMQSLSRRHQHGSRSRCRNNQLLSYFDAGCAPCYSIVEATGSYLRAPLPALTQALLVALLVRRSKAQAVRQ
jgi:hypothetical protein